MTLLLVAAHSDNSDALQKLLAAGANVNHQNYNGKQIYNFISLLIIKDGILKTSWSCHATFNPYYNVSLLFSCERNMFNIKRRGLVISNQNC